MKQNSEMVIRECDTVELLEGCVGLQRRVFALPEIEISPVRHLVVTMHAGGFTLGAFSGERLVGFCLSVPAVLNGARALYSHMTAVDDEFQGLGIGAKLKWAQRERALADGIRLIKWTFQPEKARNAFFNLEKLGAEVRQYVTNFYGTDYGDGTNKKHAVGIQSDRLFGLWELDSPKVNALAAGNRFETDVVPTAFIEVPHDWNELLKNDREAACTEQERLRLQFLDYFKRGLVCRGFDKNPESPRYLFYKS